MKYKMNVKNNIKEKSNQIRSVFLFFLSFSIFFSLLFFVYNSSELTPSGLNDANKTIYIYIIITVIMNIIILVIEFYDSQQIYIRNSKYMFIFVNTVVICLAIDELLRGSASLFSNSSDSEDAVNHTYASLSVGFAGTGTLLALIYNFYLISHGI